MIMEINPGTRIVRFLPQDKRYSSIAKYIARLGLYLHKYDKHFNQANRLPGSNYKTAAIIEVHIPYFLDQTPRLLLILAFSNVRDR